MRVLTLLSVMLFCFAAPVLSQVSLGIRGGYNASNMEMSGGMAGRISEGNMKTFHGWHIEMLVNVPVAGGLYFQPAFRYITKGSDLKEVPDPKTGLGGVYVPLGNALRLNYLEMPLNIVYKYPLGDGKITGGAGPYFARGLNGRYSYNIVQDGNTLTKHTQDVQFSRRNNDNPAVMRMHPWDAGANFAIGYEFNNCLMVGANYSHGFTDVDRSEYNTSRNRYIGVSIGVLFNREDY